MQKQKSLGQYLNRRWEFRAQKSSIASSFYLTANLRIRRTLRISFIHELDEISRQTNLTDDEVYANIKTTIRPTARGKKKQTSKTKKKRVFLNARNTKQRVSHLTSTSK